MTNTRKLSNSTRFFYSIYWIYLQYSHEGSASFIVWNGSALQWRNYILYAIYWEKGIKQFPEYDEKWFGKHRSVSPEHQWGTIQSAPGLGSTTSLMLYTPDRRLSTVKMVKEGERTTGHGSSGEGLDEGGCRLHWVGGRGWLKAFVFCFFLQKMFYRCSRHTNYR